MADEHQYLMAMNEARRVPKPTHTGQPTARGSGATLTDLVNGCQRGDKASWEAIVDRYERLVRAIALREGLSAEHASDATQETFEALIQGLYDIDEPELLGPWLMTVARRTSWRIRNRSRSEPKPRIERFDGVDDADRLARSWWVYEAVEQLDEPCRTLVRALFLQSNEPSYSEVAVQIGRPLGSIGPLRARCLVRLRSILEATSG